MSTAIRQISEFLSSSNLKIPLVGFLLLATLNLATLILGPVKILSSLNSSSMGPVLANFVFDSWGTLAGLLGAIILFAPVLLGARKQQRKLLSIYFFASSITVGLASSLIWDHFFSSSGQPSFGSSAIDISAQSIVFTLSIFALTESFISQSESKVDSYALNSFRIIYATIILTTLWFVIQLEPIFVASTQFNWRVHEIAFILGVLVTVIYFVGEKFRGTRTASPSKVPEISLVPEG